MLAKVVFNGLLGVAVLALFGAGWFFYGSLARIDSRREVFGTLQQRFESRGACAALVTLRRMNTERQFSASLRATLEDLRQEYARQVVGNAEPATASALAGAHRDGLVSGKLCEQIRLAKGLGQTHPVLTLLRFVRTEQDACRRQQLLLPTLQALDSHRPVMVHEIMRQVGRLGCLQASVARGLAHAALEHLRQRPRALDDLNAYRVARFLRRWAPRQAAALGCLVEVRGDVSVVANAIGCTPRARRRLLPRYRSAEPLTHGRGVSADPAGTEVLLLAREPGSETCQVMTDRPSPSLHRVRCDALTLVSGTQLSVRIEALRFGAVRADLIAGLGRLRPGTRAFAPAARRSPKLQTWYAYDRKGQFLGLADVTSLATVAQETGSQHVPDKPLRAFCRRTGARFCYDVDWAEVVRRVDGRATFFLSRPADGVFLEQLPSGQARQRARAVLAERFRAEARSHAVWRLQNKGILVYQAGPQGFELALQGAAEGMAQIHEFTPGARRGLVRARLLAAWDLEPDGRPELVVQQVHQQPEAASPGLESDEIVLMRYVARRNAFEPLNRLVIHEYGTKGASQNR